MTKNKTEIWQNGSTGLYYAVCPCGWQSRLRKEYEAAKQYGKNHKCKESSQ